VQGTVPTLIGNTLALFSNMANTFVLAANNGGNISSVASTDLGTSWGSAQLIESTATVDDSSEIGLVKTPFKWTAIWVGQGQTSVSYRTVAATLPTASDWASFGAKKDFLAGNSTMLYSRPSFVFTGGQQGWGLVSVDSLTSDVQFRACYDAPATLAPSAPSTPTPTKSAANNSQNFSFWLQAVIVFCVLCTFW
jgi:hypothetical protein